MHDVIDQIQVERKSFECLRLFILSGWKCLTKMNDREDNLSVKCPQIWLIIFKYIISFFSPSSPSDGGLTPTDFGCCLWLGRSVEKVNWMLICKIMISVYIFLLNWNCVKSKRCDATQLQNAWLDYFIHVFTHVRLLSFIKVGNGQPNNKQQLASQKMKIAISWMKSRFVWIAFSGSECS